MTYYYDGTRNKGENPTLSFGHKEGFEFDYGVPSIDKKPLVFKDWLDEKGVDTRIFWKNCKRKYNGFNSKRNNYANGANITWVRYAFLWDVSLLNLSDDVFYKLNKECVLEVKAAEKSGIKIELGF